MSIEEKFFESISFWKLSQPHIIQYTFFAPCKQNDIMSQSYKIVDNSKMKQGITKL